MGTLRERARAHAMAQAQPAQGQAQQGHAQQGQQGHAPSTQGRGTTGATATASGDAELALMQLEAPLLDLICEDTGESPQATHTTYFHNCPVCGHHDCFRYYRDTNTWACFGGSNPRTSAHATADGGGYVDYVLATGRARDVSGAVRLLREATGHPWEPPDWDEPLHLGDIIRDGGTTPRPATAQATPQPAAQPAAQPATAQATGADGDQRAARADTPPQGVAQGVAQGATASGATAHGATAQGTAQGATAQGVAQGATAQGVAQGATAQGVAQGATDRLFDQLDARILHTDLLTGEHRRPRPRFLVDGLISVGSINMLAAPSKQCKSWAALSLCWAVADGTPWMGFFETHRAHVLYVDVELGEDWLSQRLDDTLLREGHAAGFHVISLKGDVSTSLSMLRQWLTARHPTDYELIVIDPLYLFEEGEENAAETWIPIMRELAAIQAGCACAVLYVHHFCKTWWTQPPENRSAGSGVIGRFYEQGIILSPRQLDEEAEAALAARYGEGARAYELFTSSRNYGDADVESVVWAWPSFHADTAHDYDAFPVRGTKEAGRIKGARESADRAEALRVKKDAATGRAIAACREAGEQPTRANVMRRLPRACEREGIAPPQEATFRRGWTGANGCTHWRSDPARGWELHAIDLDAVTEETPTPWLPTADEDE